VNTMSETEIIQAAPPAPLPNRSAVGWIAWFSLREMARRRRLVSLGLINLLPVLAVLMVRIWLPDKGLTAHLQLMGLSHDMFIPFLIPVVAMAVGASAIGEQIEEGTIVYTWTRPVRRSAIYLGRLLAAQGVATVLLSLSLAMCFLVMVAGNLGVISWEFLKLYLQTFLIIGLGAFAYTALFALMGTVFKKPVLPAILFAFGYEKLVAGIPARVQELSLQFHLQNLVSRPEVVPGDIPGVLATLLNQARPRDPVPSWQSVLVLVVVAALTTVLGMQLLQHKEIEK